MSTYHPDRWVILELTKGDVFYYKVFSGNYGGFAGSNTWKLSSSIDNIVEDAEGYTVSCSSGSTYMCHKQAYGMSMYMQNIYAGWCSDDNSTISIKILDKYDKRTH